MNATIPISSLIDDLKYLHKTAYDILIRKHSDDQIELLWKYLRDFPDSFDGILNQEWNNIQIDDETYYAIIALETFMRIGHKLSKIGNSTHVSVEDLSEITKNVSIGSIHLMNSGWYPAVDFMKTTTAGHIKGGKISGAIKTKKAEPKHKILREQAAKIWETNKALSTNSVATSLIKNHGAKYSVQQTSIIIKDLKPSSQVKKTII